MTRLTRNTARPPQVGPPVAPTSSAIVHLGVGAFHKAHQAVYTQTAMRLSGDRSWGIIGVTQRSAQAAQELNPQGGLFGVLTVDREQARLDLVGSITRVLVPMSDGPQIIAALADPATHVVTITVTEKGYPREVDGSLAADSVSDDLRALYDEEAGGPRGATPPSSMLGMLVRGLAARRRAGAGSLTVISCDNLGQNGRLLERLVIEAFARAFGSEARAPLEWLNATIAFPNTMVDRIAPATTPAHHRAAEALLAATDAALAVAEPFSQWVIEDRFAGPRPAWELAGAMFVADVEPFETAKLQLLNGSHSLIAYLGALCGHETIDQAIDDPRIESLVADYLFSDAIRATTAPPGVSLSAYARDLLTRFHNPALAHTVSKVGADGSLKIAQRWVPVALNRLDDDAIPRGVAHGVAAWALLIRNRPELVVDPARQQLLELAGRASSHEQLVTDLLQLRTVFPAAIGEHDGFRAAVHEAFTELSAWQ